MFILIENLSRLVHQNHQPITADLRPKRLELKSGNLDVMEWSERMYQAAVGIDNF